MMVGRRLLGLALLAACGGDGVSRGAMDKPADASRALDSVRIARQDSLSMFEPIDPDRPAMILMISRLAEPGEAALADERAAAQLISRSRALSDSLGIRLYLRGPRLGRIADPSRMIDPPVIESLPAMVFIAPNEPLRIRVGFPTLDTLHMILHHWARDATRRSRLLQAS